MNTRIVIGILFSVLSHSTLLWLPTVNTISHAPVMPSKSAIKISLIQPQPQQKAELERPHVLSTKKHKTHRVEQPLLAATPSPKKNSIKKAKKTSPIHDKKNTIQSPIESAKVESLSPPTLASNPAPHYPHRARLKGYEGHVILNIEVLPSGHCGTISIHQSSGHRILDDAALAAVRKWRFTSAKNNSIPRSQWVKQKISFQLEKKA